MFSRQRRESGARRVATGRARQQAAKYRNDSTTPA